LSDTGQHMGGLILPGIQMMHQSLIQNTSQIPGENRRQNPDTLGLGESTQQAVENGCFYSTVATIERVINEVTEQLGSAVTTVITGGNAGGVAPLLSIELEQKPDFVLQGLAIAADIES